MVLGWAIRNFDLHSLTAPRQSSFRRAVGSHSAKHRQSHPLGGDDARGRVWRSLESLCQKDVEADPSSLVNQSCAPCARARTSQFP
jgi:hypothetical protein